VPEAFPLDSTAYPIIPSQFDNRGKYDDFLYLAVAGHWDQRASDWLNLPSVQRTVLRRKGLSP
jgi:hypothetical protein